MKNFISIISSPEKCQVSGVGEPIVKKQLEQCWEPSFEIVPESISNISILHIESALNLWSGMILCVYKREFKG